MASEEQTPEGFKGRKLLATPLGYSSTFLIVLGAIRIELLVSEGFRESKDTGMQRLSVGLFTVVISVVLVALLLISIEMFFRLKAKKMFADSVLVLMWLGVASYEQSYRIAGAAVFMPNKHPATLMQISENAFEFYPWVLDTGKSNFILPFKDIRRLELTNVELPIGKDRGVLIETQNEKFEIGFSRFLVFHVLKVSEKRAKMTLAKMQEALEMWRDGQL